MIDMPRPLFQLGQVVATPGALEALAGQSPSDLLDRHIRGDWGDVDAEDAQANDDAVAAGDLRILSVYHTKDGVKLYIITEASRESTCVLRADEY